MILAARCPQCNTAFRIVPDQLKISEGWVRCGSCQHIFDAYTTQFETSREKLEQEKQQEPQQEYQEPEIKPPVIEQETESAASTLSPISVFPDSLLQEFRISGEDDELEVIDDDTELLHSELSSSEEWDAIAPPPSDTPIGLGGMTELPHRKLKPQAPQEKYGFEGGLEGDLPDQYSTGELENPLKNISIATSSADSSFGFDDAYEQAPSSFYDSSDVVTVSDDDAIDVQDEDDFSTEDSSASTNLQSTPQESQRSTEKKPAKPNINIHKKDDNNEWVNALSSAFPSLINSTIEDTASLANSKGDEVLEKLSSSLHEQNISELSFVKNGQGSAFWQKPAVRRVCAVLAFFFVLALLAQTLYLFRSQLYARFPELQAPLTGLCQSIGCTIGYPVDAGAVRIVQTVFESTDAQNYQLELLIKNDGQQIVAVPWVELTLTNASEQIIARKTLSPQELSIAKTALQPKEELFIRQKITTDTQGVVSRNYSVLLFFP